MDIRFRHMPQCRPLFRSAARRATLWLLLLALWIQVAVLPVLAATPTAWQAELDGRIVICTAAGMVVLNDDGSPAADSKAETGPSCVFCLPLLHAGLKAATAEPLPLPALAGWAVPIPTGHVDPVQSAATGANHPPRAPPGL